LVLVFSFFGDNAMKFELVFFGGVSVKYKRNHATLEAAQAEAKRVQRKINAAAHPAIVRGPGLGADGVQA
jgi:hypothetical protein